MSLVMKISRSEYLELKRAVNILTAENESLKKELTALKNKEVKETAETAETKKKGAK
jgi:hypothetical protein